MIGLSVVKWDALDKACGRFEFPSDWSMDGMLHVKVLRAGRPHARILRIDTDKARAIAGVVCVLTHRDIPGLNGFGLIGPDQPVLCFDRVRFSGDAVAVVAAETEAVACAAVRSIEVDYEDIPALLEPVRALDPDVPQLHEAGNLCHETRFGFGDVDRALAGSRHVVRIAYATGRQEHAYLEPEAGISFIDERRRIAVVCGGQNPFADRRQLAATLALPEEQIWVSHPPMGGAFGGKEDLNVQAPLALVTHITRRPARMIYDRDESIGFSVKRHRFEVTVEVGADAEGRLTGFRADMLADTGAYRTLGPGVMTLAAEHVSGPYRFAASDIRGRVVHTNSGNASAFRGFGNPQAILGIEQAMDELADRLGMDGIEFRCRNLLRAGDRAAAGHILTGEVTLAALADRARDSDLLRPPEVSGPIRRATGLAFVWQGFGLGSGAEPGSTVRLTRDEHGDFTLDLSQPDLGQGNLTAFLQIAADALGCEMKAVRLSQGTTDNANSWSTNASRSLAVTGPAVRLAAERVLARIEAGENGLIEETAHFGPQFQEQLEIGAPHLGYAYGIQLVRLAVDTVTGEATVGEAETYLDPGTVINPDGVTGQIEGGFAQGLGFALSEDLFLQGGRVCNDRFSSYIVPTIRDVPSKLRTVLVGTPEAGNPLGVRGVAEIGLTPVAPAIANALKHITGRRFPDFPILPEAIVDTVQEEPQ